MNAKGRGLPSGKVGQLHPAGAEPGSQQYFIPREQMRSPGVKDGVKMSEGWMGKEESYGDRQTGDR